MKGDPVVRQKSKKSQKVCHNQIIKKVVRKTLYDCSGEGYKKEAFISFTQQKNERRKWPFQTNRRGEGLALS